MSDKPSIDERIQALTHNLELAMLEREKHERLLKRLDERERKARQAIMAGIAAYFRIIDEDENGSRPEEP